MHFMRFDEVACDSVALKSPLFVPQ